MPSDTGIGGAPGSSYQLAQMLERIMTMTYALGDARELRASQWAALRYFGQEGNASRTVKSFAEHNSTSTASASQTVSTLVRRGLLSSATSRNDGRSKVVTVTRAGALFMERDPLNALAAVLESVGAGADEVFRETLLEAAQLLDRKGREDDGMGRRFRAGVDEGGDSAPASD